MKTISNHPFGCNVKTGNRVCMKSSGRINNAWNTLIFIVLTFLALVISSLYVLQAQPPINKPLYQSTHVQQKILTIFENKKDMKVINSKLPQPQAVGASSGAVTLRLDSAINATTTLGDYQRAIYSYGNSCEFDFSTYYDWNNSLRKWDPILKREYEFDAQGKIVLEIRNYWDESLREWIPTLRHVYTLNVAGNATEINDFLWDEDTATWLNFTKTENTYNARGFLTQQVYSNFDFVSGLFKNAVKTEYVYNAGNLQTLETNFQWNETTSKWVEANKYDFTYDASNRLAMSVFSKWNLMTASWENSERDEFSYATGSKINLHVTSVWNINQWVNESGDEHSYDGNGNELTVNFYLWNVATGQWGVKSKNEFNYNPNYLTSDLCPGIFFIFGEWGVLTNVMTENKYTEMKTDGSGWDSYALITRYYYSEYLNTEVHKSENPGLSLYPNPVKNKLTVKGLTGEAKLKIVDAQGKEWYSGIINKDVELNVANLEKGFYILKLMIGEQSYNFKLIKE